MSRCRRLDDWIAAGRAAAVALLLAGGGGAAQAQFSMLPSSAHTAPPAASEAADEPAYRKDAARHLYGAFPLRIHKGKLPPMMYAVMITDTEIDATGKVVDVKVARPPASAKEVAPWVVQLIRRAAPYPAPARLVKAEGGVVVWREIWLVDRTGLFQVDALTEGQL